MRVALKKKLFREARTAFGERWVLSSLRNAARHPFSGSRQLGSFAADANNAH